MEFRLQIIIFVIMLSCLIELNIFASPVTHNTDRPTPRSIRNQSLEFINSRTWDENVQQLRETRIFANKSVSQEADRKIPPRRRSELMKSKSSNAHDRVKIPFEGGGEYLLLNADQQRHKVNVGQDFRLSEEEDEEIAKRILFRHWPNKMAAYIYETGDEETVASTVENYLQLGILDREQALLYLQRIKSILDGLHAQDVRNKKREEQQYYENLLTNRKNLEEINDEVPDLKDIRRFLQNLLLTALTDSLLEYSNGIVDNETKIKRSYSSSNEKAPKVTHDLKKRKVRVKEAQALPKNSIATSGIEDES